MKNSKITAHSGKNEPILSVNDIKQYIYCPRIVFFNQVMPVERKATYKMEYGKLAEDKIKRLENRRRLKKYNLDKGKRLFNLWMSSSKLGFSGKLDMLIISPSGCFPVDFKYTKGVAHKNHHYQLGGYALLVEEEFNIKANRGFIYLIPQNDVTVFELTEQFKKCILQLVEEMRIMILKEQMPDMTFFRNRCQDCEFRNYCGDVF